MQRIITLLIILLLAMPAFAGQHRRSKPTKRSYIVKNRSKIIASRKKPAGKFIPLAKPVELTGSPERLLQVNQFADVLGIPKTSSLEELVPLPENAALLIDENLAPDKRFCRTRIITPLLNLAKEYRAKFGKPLRVTGAFRSLAQQAALAAHNRNAAPTDGPTASMHLRGNTIDFGRSLLTQAEDRWLQDKFRTLKAAGVVDAIQENNRKTGGYCYHVTFWCHEPSLLPTFLATFRIIF